VAAGALAQGVMIGVYVHIPFCHRRCLYCDFVSEATPGNVPNIYVDALCREIAAFDGPSEIRSIFLGGGTPSLLAPHSLERILDTLNKRFRFSNQPPSTNPPEITLEANPDDVTPDLADAWRRLGVNRVSLGVQSFDDDVLRYLGRRHDARGALDACAIVAERFTNWSMDLIFGALPADRWEATLEQCAALDPPHVSAYGLTYEAGTPFEARAEDAIDEDVWLRLYQRAETMLPRHVHYEISNFARPGYEARHNLIYWRNEEYAGFGTGAYSFLRGVRARNLVGAEAYLAQPGGKSEALRLSDREIRVETVIQHLRLKAGLPKASYRQRFGANVEDDFGLALRTLIERGLIAEDAEALRPTSLGFQLNNEIGLALI
jgi:oxygen-independent coproporphyrinogen-3 oxidase